MSELDYIEGELYMERARIEGDVMELSDEELIKEMVGYPKDDLNAVGRQFPAWTVADRLSRNGYAPSVKQRQALQNVLVLYRHENQIGMDWDYGTFN